MNILIPHLWLLEHLDTKATPNQIQSYLSLCGPSVERINKVDSESVYDIEVTTNRVDSMSVRGIAREAASILPEFNIKAALKPLDLPSFPKITKPLPLKITNDPKLCHRLVGIIIDQVKLKPSPSKMSQRLEQVGMRGLNNAVDITNYAMHEIGHPIHAFDYDQIMALGGHILVRLAKKGETFTTLDNKKFTTLGGEIVFDNGQGQIIDLPGIMGTKNTVVTESTKKILLFVESVDSQKIRFASMSHAIRTQAAQLNEKDADPELALQVLQRATQLLLKYSGGTIASNLIDLYPRKPKATPTNLTQKQIDTYLGLHIPPQRINRILTNLGCQVSTTQTSSTDSKQSINCYSITPPSFRANDLQIPQDYIEEIARIYGYHNLPSVIMPTPIPDNPPHEDFSKEYLLKNLLAGFGLQEVYSYSMVSSALASQSGQTLTNHLAIKNPLADDAVYLRRTLIPSHLQIIVQNKNHSDFAIFELAHTYIPRKNQLPHEHLHLTITTTKDYRYLKGILDALAQKLFIQNLSINPKIKNLPPPFITNLSGEIIIGKHSIGHIGQVSSDPQAYSLEIPVYQLLPHASTHPSYLPTNTTPPIIEDLTFTLPPRTHVGPVIDHIYSISPLIHQVTLKDIYKHNHTFTITYLHPSKQLSTDDITPLRKKIITTLSTKFTSKLVGTLST